MTFRFKTIKAGGEHKVQFTIVGWWTFTLDQRDIEELWATAGDAMNELDKLEMNDVQN